MKKFPLLVLAGLFLAGNLSFAAEFEGVGGLPAHPDPADPRTKDWFIYTLDPGETKEDELLVVNNSDHEITVLLYPADSTPSTDGGFALKQAVEPRTGVGKWITLKKTELTLEPYGSEAVPFTITIPEEPSPDVGEHTGGILIERAGQNQGESGGICISTRVGVRVYVTIPGEIIHKLDLERFTMEDTPGTPFSTVAVTVRNSGNVSEDVTVRLRVRSNWEWLNEIPFLPSPFREFPVENIRELQVLRGDALTSNFEFRKPPLGTLEAEAVVEYDEGKKMLTTHPIILQVSADRNLLLLGGLILAFLISLLLFLLFRKRKETEQEPPASKPVVRKAPEKRKGKKPSARASKSSSPQRR